MAIKVIGHIAPDTDTVCSAITYAWFLINKKSTDAQAYTAGKINKETQFVLDHFKVNTPEVLEKFSPQDQVVIVDTNNPSELLPGIKEVQLEEIIDHHKLVGGLSTEKPIHIRIVPIACTATIIFNLIQESGSPDIPSEIAGLMLCSILSDTLKFTSPTTTETDKTAAVKLAQICNEDINSLAEKMFEAKSDLSGMSINDILNVDSKVFEFGNKKARISVLETTKPDNSLALFDDLTKEMLKIKDQEKLDNILLFVVDIIKSQANVIVASENDKILVEKAFAVSFTDKILVLPGVVSRKKQIIPKIEGSI